MRVRRDTHTHSLSFCFLRTHRETQICMYIQIQVAVFPIDRIRAHLPSTRESDMFSNSPLFIFITSRYNQSKREREREKVKCTHTDLRHISPHSVISHGTLGLFAAPVSTFSTLRTTNNPSPSTLPNTTCLPSSHAHGPHVMKN